MFLYFFFLSLAGFAAERRPVDTKVDAAAKGLVTINNVCGSVDVAAADTLEVHVVGALLGESAELHVERKGDRVAIVVEQDGSRKSDPVCAELQITVPAASALSADLVSADVNIQHVTGKLKLSSVSGNMNVTDATGSLDLETVSGEIEVEGATPELHAEAVSGDMKVSGTELAVAELQTVSGEINVRGGAFRRIDIESVSGDIDVQGDLVDGSQASLESHSGDVILRIPSQTPGSFTLSSFSGSVDADDSPAEADSHGKNSLSFTRGQGTSTVKLDSFSGDVSLRAR